MNEGAPGGVLTTQKTDLSVEKRRGNQPTKRTQVLARNGREPVEVLLAGAFDGKWFRMKLSFYVCNCRNSGIKNGILIFH